jgi:hypothetical protein
MSTVNRRRSSVSEGPTCVDVSHSYKLLPDYAALIPVPEVFIPGALVQYEQQEHNRSGLLHVSAFLQSVVNRESGMPPSAEEVTSASADLNILLLRCLELSKDIARMHNLVKRIAQYANAYRPGGHARGKYRSTRASSPLYRWQPPLAKRARRQSPANPKSKRPTRSELERACRIALMEANQPASVEAIYARIERRGSITFAGYKRPFRAITLAMNALTKQGEASLLQESGSRRWRWETEARTV